jgi:hypothetical protein
MNETLALRRFKPEQPIEELKTGVVFQEFSAREKDVLCLAEPSIALFVTFLRTWVDRQ